MGALAALAFGVLVAHHNGWVENPFAREVMASDGSNGPVPEGVLVPLSAVGIPAYTKLTRDHFIFPGEFVLAKQYLPEESVAELGLTTDLGELIGRVLARPKAAGYAFRPSDFLPEGTRPGLVGGIPSGMRGLRIGADSIQGIAGLSAGDRFDIIAAQEIVNKASQPSLAFSGVFAPQAEAAMLGKSRRARVQVLVQGGVVVEPLTTRQVPVSSATLTRGLTVRTKPVQELVVAVRPEEIAPLMEALAIEAKLTCSPRSGRPDDPVDSLTPALNPQTDLLSWPTSGDGTSGAHGLTLVDRIDGDKRQIVPIPGLSSKGLTTTEGK
jgi:hypothetical protein